MGGGDGITASQIGDGARDLVARLGVLSSVSFEPANIHEINLLQNAYDADLLGQITDYFTSAQNINSSHEFAVP